MSKKQDGVVEKRKNRIVPENEEKLIYTINGDSQKSTKSRELMPKSLRVGKK